MQDIQQTLARVVREARIAQDLTKENLAEAIGFDTHTIINIEAGRGNPKFEKLYPLITYLKIPADKIFYPGSKEPNPELQNLLTELHDCNEQEAKDLIPIIRYVLGLLRKENEQAT